MARISGIDIPKRKQIVISLTYIYGIGKSRAKKILEKVSIDPMVQTEKLTDDEINQIRKIIDTDYKVEGELRTDVSMDIKRLMDLGCYRGLRHRKSLPCRGQNTQNNARTRKGPKKTAVKKKKKV